VTERRASRWRPPLSWLFLLLFCLAAPVELLTGWARQSALDTESYTRTAGALAAVPRLQEAVAQAMTTRAERELAGENPSASQAVIARQTAKLLGEATRQVVASEAFRQTWEEANRQAHRSLANELALGWGQPVTLDLSPLHPAIMQAAAVLGVDLPPGDTFAAALDVPLLDAATADQVRRATRQLNLVFWALLAVTLATLALTVALAPDRLAAIARAAFGLAIGMAVLMTLILVAQGWAVSAAALDGGGAVTGAILESITQSLRLLAVALAGAGLAVAAAFTGLASVRQGISRRPLEA
jgi:hypothetical protein